MNALFYLLLVASFLSLTLFELLCSLLFLYTIFNFKRLIDNSTLSVGVITYSLSTLLGTALFNTQMFFKALEQALLPLIFMSGKRIEVSISFFSITNTIIMILGSLSLVVATFRYISIGEFKPIWGGPFEAGFISSLLSITFLTYSFVHLKDKNPGVSLAFFLAGILCSAMTVLISKRALVLALFACFLLLLFVVRKHINPKLVLISSALLLLSTAAGFMYMKERDDRFKNLYQVITLQKDLDMQTLDTILSNRAYLFSKGLEVVKEDFHEGNIVNILVGHGVRPGFKLNLKEGDHREGSYESVFLLSEFIERGAIGLLGILLVYVSFFRILPRLSTLEIRELVILPSLFLLGIHLFSSIFTYFWDALLPLHILAYTLAHRYIQGRK